MTDRLKRMISVSGYKVWPAEVEATLHSHPAVHEACVIATPDARSGEAVKALVVPRPEAALDAAALIAWCRASMAVYKAPKRRRVRRRAAEVEHRQGPVARASTTGTALMETIRYEVADGVATLTLNRPGAAQRHRPADARRDRACLAALKRRPRGARARAHRRRRRVLRRRRPARHRVGAARWRRLARPHAGRARVGRRDLISLDRAGDRGRRRRRRTAPASASRWRPISCVASPRARFCLSFMKLGAGAGLAARSTRCRASSACSAPRS